MVSKKSNTLYRLDHAEYQYHLINQTLSEFHPRLKTTPKYYNSKGKKSSKKMEKLLQVSNSEQLSRDVNALKLELLNNKVHYAETKLTHYFFKQLENQYSMLHNKKDKEDTASKKLQCLEELKTSIDFLTFSRLLARSKVIKVVISKVCSTRGLKNGPPEWFEGHDILKEFNDKDADCNPSRVWNKVIKGTAGLEQLVSQLMNVRSVKELISGLEAGIEIVLGARKNALAEESTIPGDSNSKVVSKATAASSDDEALSSKSNEEYDSEKSGSEDDSSTFEEDLENCEEIDEEQILAQYKGMVVASDDEDTEEVEYQLDTKINYNEVTDEEPSEASDDNIELSDNEEEEPRDGPAKKKQRNEINPTGKLPALMAGYYSGDEEGGSTDDDVAKAQLSNKPQRKNRRGQRARQKIWEMKYGRSANHIQKQFKKEHEERETKRREYEERVAKRAAREAGQQRVFSLAERSKMREMGKNSVRNSTENQPLHPSWEAKKLAEEKRKNAKFQGKKITFD
ncbi:Bud22p Ecym_4586 [Eremothecium cymbalariae DBVPG|uniref:Bud22 domain-containing protein n=1 Tax=Eremothecium cymbalariae (strain CBS 270.75 / DBVPG 7215 / KCTC 17166 / NRRL Y-17582) TaxID=931890 RepID=G8JS97_ERECY|nr:hypothetical protein Ecym_4586 [Eremothecium cymbalariae DBVPG\